MQTRQLQEDEYLGTFAPPMQDVTLSATAVLDVWPYVASIPTADLLGHAIYDDLVEYVYRSGDEQFDHVLVMTRTKNVYLVVVVDLHRDAIFGHYLLDLNEKYGVEPPRRPGPIAG